MSATLVWAAGMLWVTTLAGCTDKAKPVYELCLKNAGVNPEWAIDDCKRAVSLDPNSTAGKAAATKLSELEDILAKRREEKRKADEAAAQAALETQKASFKTMPTTLDKKIRDQAMWDLGRGTVTPVMAVITKEIGQPVASYEGSYGAIHSHVWGARPSSTSLDDIRATPFAVSMVRGLTCGDYGGAEIEWYSEGQRLRP